MDAIVNGDLEEILKRVTSKLNDDFELPVKKTNFSGLCEKLAAAGKSSTNESTGANNSKSSNIHFFK